MGGGDVDLLSSAGSYNIVRDGIASGSSAHVMNQRIPPRGITCDYHHRCPCSQSGHVPIAGTDHAFLPLMTSSSMRRTPRWGMRFMRYSVTITLPAWASCLEGALSSDTRRHRHTQLQRRDNVNGVTAHNICEMARCKRLLPCSELLLLQHGHDGDCCTGVPTSLQDTAVAHPANRRRVTTVPGRPTTASVRCGCPALHR